MKEDEFKKRVGCSSRRQVVSVIASSYKKRDPRQRSLLKRVNECVEVERVADNDGHSSSRRPDRMESRVAQGILPVKRIGESPRWTSQAGDIDRLLHGVGCRRRDGSTRVAAARYHRRHKEGPGREIGGRISWARRKTKITGGVTKRGGKEENEGGSRRRGRRNEDGMR